MRKGVNYTYNMTDNANVYKELKWDNVPNTLTERPIFFV